MKNFIQKGITMDYPVADKAVRSGEIIVVGEVAGVAETDGTPGDTIALETRGVFELPKGAGALAQGVKAYVAIAEDGTKTIVGTASGNKLCGYVWKAAAAADSTVFVKLN